jgi:hypothetical protein
VRIDFDAGFTYINSFVDESLDSRNKNLMMVVVSGMDQVHHYEYTYKAVLALNMSIFDEMSANNETYMEDDVPILTFV